MFGTDYAPRKTSITQLLNPLVPTPPQDHHGRPPALPAFSSTFTASAQHYRHPHQSLPHSAQDHQPHFGLRAANWDATVDFTSRQTEDYEHRDIQPRVSQDVPSTSYSAWSSSLPMTSGQYQASPVNPSYSNERTTLSGNHTTDSSHPTDALQMGYDGPHSEFQPSERASTRIAARATATDHPHDRQCHVPVDVPSAYTPSTPSTSLVSVPTGKSQKRSRKSAEVEEEVGTSAVASTAEPKPKKPRAKSKSVSTGNATKSKKGYPAKKRNEAAQIVANAGQMMQSPSYSNVNGKGKGKLDGGVALSFISDSAKPDAHPATRGSVIAELQFARCMSNRYKSDEFPRCVSCTRRWAGDTCRFQGIRFLIRDENRNLMAVSFVESQKSDSPSMILPTKWNVELEPHHVDRIMRTVAGSLLSHLKLEQKHVTERNVVRRPRETEVRATCDTCMTSLFSSSWMCRQCGREACADCYAIVKELTGESMSGPMSAMTALQSRRDKHAQANPFFLSCTRRNEHGTAYFSPVSRFCENELRDAVREMEILVQQSEPALSDLADEKGRYELDGCPRGEMPSPTVNDLPSSAKPANDSISTPSTLGPSASVEFASTNGPPDPSASTVGTIVKSPTPPVGKPLSMHYLPAYRTQYFRDSVLTDEIFRKQWMLGEPIVVVGLLPKFHIQWTPEYFIQKYQAESCSILECQTDASKRVTVGEFFSWFGKYEGRTETWKLKDWPPSTDFKTAFPELYDDFVRAVPVPTYTRRDGAMNIASHFPSNTIAPDLGPKMYNAFASSEAPGSKGSTRLHMDMADAVNIMLYAAPTPSGEPGRAVWDIFRAEDAKIIRKFLRKHFKGTYQNDPIHAQLFYLDSDLRWKLFEEFGVKSYRIYQNPGEAVFIPAGCAHQVCNLSDCIKVACDFVSPENIQRCETLTLEFRDQNQTMVWKEDVLQLRTMMWFAWLSCRRYVKKFD